MGGKRDTPETGPDRVLPWEVGRLQAGAAWGRSALSSGGKDPVLPIAHLSCLLSASGGEPDLILFLKSRVIKDIKGG